MTRLPKKPVEPIAASMERMLREGQELRPRMLLLYEQDALMKREKHMAFVRAGFTDAQAFELCRG